MEVPTRLLKTRPVSLKLEFGSLQDTQKDTCQRLLLAVLKGPFEGTVGCATSVLVLDVG